ncbi:MAG: hypothetical protein GWO20_12010 [Candidatus Korarchaeota archaeon]|nr:hypothetical protein [Candidatus Korarchaeota archaeon]NIU84156.1 hypothetical protein [Candidatus Thorarchaeota archaeon]NIW14301.1 hypothetical protein [Candidatus Thorarchaeota archaeon]NIW52398.1 hypothetical protein [Candidatus Korarchaeota archaeon]
MSKLSKDDRWSLIKKLREKFDLTAFHTRSYDSFIKKSIRKVIESYPEIKADVGWYFDFKVSNPNGEEEINIDVEQPLTYDYDGTPVRGENLTPNVCRLRDMTYSIPIQVEVALKKVNYESGKRKDETIRRQKIRLLLLPLLLGSMYDPNLGRKIKDEDYFAKLGEDPLDPDGYFIINGSERGIIGREESVRGRIITERLTGSSQRAKKYYARAWIVSPGIYRNRATVYIGEDDFRLYCTFTKAGKQEKIPFVLLMRALGYTVRDIVITMAPEEYYEESYQGAPVTSLIQLNTQKLSPNVLRSQEEALYELAKYMSYFKIPINEENKEQVIEEVKRRLERNLIPYFGKGERALATKGYYLSRMARRLILMYFDRLEAEDRDHLKNKRLKLIGDFLQDLFSYSWRNFVYATKRKLTNWVTSKGEVTSIKSVLRVDKLQNKVMRALSTGSWPTGIMGVTTTLDRINLIDTQSSLRKVKNILARVSPGALRGKVEARDLHPTHYGRFCPNETPEGELCGLTQHLSLMSYVTTPLERNKLKELEQFLHDKLSVKKDTDGMSPDLSTWPDVPVFLNGGYIGHHSDPEDFVKAFRDARREGEIDWRVSVKHWDKYKEIHINGDGGRILRPLIVVEDGNALLKKKHIEKLRNGSWEFVDLLKHGFIEMLDPEEEEDALIATERSKLTPDHTHMEIASAATLGIAAGVIPFANHDQSPRVTAEASMAKQAMTIPRLNYRIRPESRTYFLHYPQKPLVTTNTSKIANVDERGFGQNAILAILSYEGYNIEDALIFNKSSIERGFMRGSLIRTYDTEERRYIGSQRDEIRMLGSEIRGSSSKGKWYKLGEDGIAWTGSYLSDEEVIVSRESPSKASTGGVEAGLSLLRDTSKNLRRGEAGLVDKVFITTEKEGRTIVRSQLRQPRYPVLGDKFASRHGQKGVIGLVVPQEDMPFTEEGMVPDLILNPHSIPSRMTIGQLLESLAGDIATETGERFDGTAFESDNWMKELKSKAKEVNLNYYGEKTLYNGKTGERFKAHILMGPVYYQRLKHLVKDKVHTRAKGKVTIFTLQPPGGRSRGGGLRLGEMERDALLAHGLSQLLHERFLDSSDGVEAYVCDSCGSLARYDPERERWICPIHKDETTVSNVVVPYSFILLINEIQSMGIRVSLGTEDRISF